MTVSVTLESEASSKLKYYDLDLKTNSRLLFEMFLNTKQVLKDESRDKIKSLNKLRMMVLTSFFSCEKFSQPPLTS